MGYEPRIELVQEVSDEYWEGAERFWIAHFRSIGCRLTNVADGGRGALGLTHSEETIAKMIAGWKDPELRNRRWTAMIKSCAQRGDEMSAAMSRVWERPEHSERVAIARTEAWKDPAVRERHRVGLLGHEVTESTRSKLSAALKGHEVTEETREKIRAKTRESWLPGGASHRSETPERRAARSAAMAAGWAPGGHLRIAHDRKKAERLEQAS
jgi:hypothetical protein